MSSLDQASLVKLYNHKLQNSVNDIDSHAIQILKRLKESGFQAYLVGGGVRDLLVNLKPKDFDIATNALPNEVKRKVSHSFIIGRRFKLVHAKRGEHIYEIATFRRAATNEELETTEQDDRKHVEENFFGNIEEDSFRRDFTINSLFYDPIDHKIVDHCKGLDDIHSRTLRMIGEPKERLIEDPVRILRAIRLSQKLNFTIEQNLRAEIVNLKQELLRTVLPRRREEWLKFFRLKNVEVALMELYDLNVFEMLIPQFHKLFSDDSQREDFLNLIGQFKYLGVNFSDPIELFCMILASYLSAKNPKGFNINNFLENEEFLLFCRDELGVFKAEVSIFFQAMLFLGPLTRKEIYLKKGERRQRSLVTNQSFFLALKLGLITTQLSHAELLFWMNEYERLTSAPI
ncbi:poly(A) polymerase [bacterium]|nr:poly(A) polymerase [bacterium]